MYGSPASEQPRPSDRFPGSDASAWETVEQDAGSAADVRRADTVARCGARATAARIRSLIAHQDAGDVCAAARRLGVPVRQLVQLEAALAPLESSDDADDAIRTLLSAVVYRYQASAVWLLTGCHDPDPSSVPPDVAEQLASLCVAVAGRVLEEYQASCVAGGAPVTSDAEVAIPRERA